MAFIFTKGDIFKSKCQALINPVNTVGVMGAGLAKQFKVRYPKMFKEYKERCQRKEVVTGKMDIHTGETILINFPTKKDWRHKSNIEWIKNGLDDLNQYLMENENISSIAIPKIGCGYGGLNWELQVKPLILEKLSEIPEIFIYIYE